MSYCVLVTTITIAIATDGFYIRFLPSVWPLNQSREEDERMASKRAAAAISSAADGDGGGGGDGDGDGDEEAALAAGPGEEGGKKPRTLLEAAKELKKATANMDAGTIKQMRAKEEEHRMLKEANQVGGGGGASSFTFCLPLVARLLSPLLLSRKSTVL